MSTKPPRPDTAFYGYIPTESTCIIFVALFSISTIVHAGQATKHRLWWLFPTAIFGGLLEMAGWGSRLWSSLSVRDKNPFEIQLITTLCGPTPLAAANFTMLGAIIIRLGAQFSRVGPKKYTAIFLSSDIFSLFVQGIGGGIAAHAVTTGKSAQLGQHIMLTGIVLQLVTIVGYILCAAEFLYRYFHARPLAKYVHERLPPPLNTPLTRRMKLLLLGMALNMLFLLIRAIYRVVELSDGFRGRIARTEVYFTVLDGAMIVLAIFSFNFAHPGPLMYNAPPAGEALEMQMRSGRPADSGKFGVVASVGG
ncbi:hypothetical protein MKEN_00946300 [Mycena kentingensis (nom. inval.)]|nr:hypothetical protein MKEN_00946300 [Mycena kentingensis (nom. inval.)]